MSEQSVTTAQPDLAFIARLIKPFIPKARMIFLAGSRAVTGPQAQSLTSSDFDILVVGKNTQSSLSILAWHTRTGNSYDIVLRDRASYEKELLDAVQSGFGTLVHMGAFNTLLEGDAGRAAAFCERNESIYRQGPLLDIPAEQRQKKIFAVAKQAVEIASKGAPEGRMIARLMLIQKIGVLAQDLCRDWNGRGKFLSRLLAGRQPSLHAALVAATHEAAAGEDKILRQACLSLCKIATRPFETRVTIDEPLAAFHSNAPQAPLFRKYFHEARKNPQLLRKYLLSGQTTERRAAVQWLELYHHRAAEPLTALRYAQSYDDYVFSLARYLGVLVSLVTHRDKASPKIGHTPLAADYLSQREPWAPEAVRAALKGQPDLLRAHGAEILKSLGGRPLAMTGPDGHRPVLAL